MPFPFPVSRLVAEYQAKRRFFPEPPRALVVPDSAREAWALETLAVNIEELGQGETEGNNRGEAIRKYCAPHSDGLLWCAAIQGWGLATAAQRLDIPMLVKRSFSAKVQAENIAAIGHRFDDWRAALPGDFLLFGRPGGHHLTILERIELVDLSPCSADSAHLVEGNHCPTVVRNERRPDAKGSRFLWGASVRRAP